MSLKPRQNAEELYHPEEIYMYLTLGCMCKCPHCYVDAKMGRPKMKWEEVKHFIDQAKKRGWNRVGLIGGEPLISKKEFFRTLEYALQQGMEVNFMSNAFWALCDKKNAHRILEKIDRLGKKYNKRIDMGLSLDGHHKLKGEEEARKIPKAVANVIAAFVEGGYANLSISLGGQSDKESRMAVRRFFDRCEERGVALKEYKSGRTGGIGSKGAFSKEPLAKGYHIFKFSDGKGNEKNILFYEGSVGPGGRGMDFLEARGIITDENRDEFLTKCAYQLENDAPHSKRLVIAPLESGLCGGMIQPYAFEGKGVPCCDANGNLRSIDVLIGDIRKEYNSRALERTKIIDKYAEIKDRQKHSSTGIRQ